MWPVSVRFHAQLLLRVEGEPVYVMNEDLLGATSFDAFKSVTLAGSVDKIGTVLAAKHKRAVLSQTTVSLGGVYTCDDWSRKLLIEQAVGRGIKGCQNWRIDALLERIRQWDQELSLEQLREHLAKRGIKGNYRTQDKALQRLSKHDEKEDLPEYVRTTPGDAEGEVLSSEHESEGSDGSSEDIAPVRPMRKRKRAGGE